MSVDSMEDKIHRAGCTDKFTKAVESFLAGSRNRDQEHILYDSITNCGASPEEVDEYIDLLLQGGD